VHFGEGAGFDARAVVTGGAEPFTIVAGVPARMIGGRA
jgi:acetyltransferase-like isoleucine patch superfamily enzyme